MPRRPALLLSVLLFCAAGTSRAGELPALQPAELGSTGRVHLFDGAYIASQPAASDLQLAHDRGIRTIINLRRPEEPAGFDEPAEAARLGLAYVALPWAGPDELTDEVFDRARALLRDSARPLLLHCGSGNRAAAVWLPWRVLDDGASYEAALAEARTIGLATPEFEQKARAYIERRLEVRW